MWRRLVLPKRIENWSLTSLQQRLVKTGGRLVKHARYYWLLLAEWHLTRRVFEAMLRRIWALPVAEALAAERISQSERRLQTVRCLRNGLGKRLSRRVPYAGGPEPAGSAWPRAAEAKKIRFNCSPRGGPVYTPAIWEPIIEIPAKKIPGGQR